MKVFDQFLDNSQLLKIFFTKISIERLYNFKKSTNNSRYSIEMTRSKLSFHLHFKSIEFIMFRNQSIGVNVLNFRKENSVCSVLFQQFDVVIGRNWIFA